MQIRVDDFPGTKPDEFWKHNLENFKKFDAVMEKHGVRQYTLGVIPKYTTDEHIRWLSENERVYVALHGIQHDERYPNEFREFETEDDIYRKVIAASERLGPCNPSGTVVRYIPPHNVIDRKTCNALKQAGYLTVMGGPGSSPDVLEYANSIGLYTLYSRHPIWYGRTDEMMADPAGMERMLVEGKTLQDRCLTLHWPWEFNIGLRHLDLFLLQIRDIMDVY